MNVSAAKDIRFHLTGHSFGCIVASAAVAGPTGSRLPRAVDSVALVQGALSVWSYCSDIPTAPTSPGYFRRVVLEKMVRGPIITTQSTFDRAVGTWYPWAAGAMSQVSFAPEDLPRYGAVGTFGIQGLETAAEKRVVLTPDRSYGFESGKISNIDASGVINVVGGFSGAHSDIAKPEVGHAVWEAVMTK
jgi:pimeloyl-ACP methyl ester carboxylesterase